LVRFNFFLLLIILISSAKLIPQVYPDERVDFLLKTGINCIVEQDYDQAKLIFTSLDNEFPDLPLGKIYLAATSIAEAYDYAEEFDDDYILDNLDEAKEQSEELIDNVESNIWYHYFHALAEGYTAYYHAIKENWFSALSSGVDAMSEFENILFLDENFYEAYITIGTFEYWKSSKMEFMNWLPFSTDTRKIGIDRLRIAIDSSTYNSYLAINSLIWIYIDQKKYSDAIEISEKALKDFPESRTFKWGMARAYEEIDPKISIRLYLEILNSYPSNKSTNHINEIVLKHIIAQQYDELGDTRNAIKYCDQILSIENLPSKTESALSERLERVKSLKKELTESN
jgi:tetratricopeptide (TPR) repeat protein